MPWSLLAEVEPAREAGGGRPEASPVYRPAFHKDSFPVLEGIETCYDLFRLSCAANGPHACLGSRAADGPYTFMSYDEVDAAVAAAAAGYAGAGLVAGDRVGILGANCPEWMIAMQALNRMSLVCVPLYETLGHSAVDFIVRHSGTRLVVVSAAKLPVVARSMADVKDLVDCGVVVWGEATEEALKPLRDLGVRAVRWADFLAAGAAAPVPPVPPRPSDTSTIMYTSGTTGDPKGVVLRHSGIVSCVASIKAFLSNCRESMGTDDAYLSYLPMAHIFDRVVQELMLHVGGSIGYWRGDVKLLMDDLAALRPTLFAGVPRVFERVYNGIRDKVAKGSVLSRAVFNWAFARKDYYMRAGWRHDQASPISDWLVFNGVKARLGGRVRVLVSGSAPLAPQMEDFMRVAMGAPFVQGYGLTETMAASFIATPDNPEHAGTVGAPMPATELRLEGVPELGYSPMGQPPRGEVCIRGPALFSGYYKSEEMTKEAMDPDGFFHTGDIGELVADGSLRIIDRKKNIFKLSQGEYIAVEKVENAYKSCPLVEQIWVYGDSLKAALVAVVVPAEKALTAWAEQHAQEAGAPPGADLAALCASPAAAKHVLAALAATAKEQRLNSLEVVRAVHLTPEQFTVENELMTPSYKLKRAPLLKRYKAAVDKLYAQLEAAEAAKGGRGG